MILLLLPVAGYLGLCLYAALFANGRVFPSPPSGYRDSPDILKFQYNDAGDAVSMVYLFNPNSRYLVYYHHGNGEDLQSVLPRLKFLEQAGFSVLAWDYPGYGTSDGQSTEKLVQEIAQKIWESLPSEFGYGPEQVILYGRSLGGGPAIRLAVEHKAAGLVLEGCFTSIFRVGLGASILPWDIFNNQAEIGSIRCPVLVIHGTDDPVVPFSHGKRLFEKAPQPKTFTWIEDGGHSDIIEKYPEVYYTSLNRFLELISTQ